MKRLDRLVQSFSLSEMPVKYGIIPTLSLKKYKRAANPLRHKGFRCSLISFRCCIWSFGVIFEFFKLHEPFVPFHAQ
ncbi:hypothetical protein E3V42_05390 [Streptococcus pseudopneumoniae]|nr:hypothetical protein E3V42_05390 [Streptococcus pseudopneumoniae]